MKPTSRLIVLMAAGAGLTAAAAALAQGQDEAQDAPPPAGERQMSEEAETPPAPEAEEATPPAPDNEMTEEAEEESEAAEPAEEAASPAPEDEMSEEAEEEPEPEPEPAPEAEPEPEADEADEPEEAAETEEADEAEDVEDAEAADEAEEAEAATSETDIEKILKADAISSEEKDEAGGAEETETAEAENDESDEEPAVDERVVIDTNPYPSTYQPLPSETVLLTGAVVLDGLGGMIEDGQVLIEGGRIAAVGESVEAPDDVETVDMDGAWITPGVIDVHSHLGVYPSPSIAATSDGNEATEPVTADMWAEHSVWPQDPGFSRALAGGVTTLQILPGSANLFGGRSVVLKNIAARTVQGMKFPDAPYGMKMACGENPSRVYGNQGRSPATDMGNMAGYRKAWIQAEAYQRKWDDYNAEYDAYLEKSAAERAESDPPSAPDRDLEMETLAGALSGDILVHQHCYRADQMAQIIDMSKEFGYQVVTFEHAVEAYKIGDLLAEEGICSSMWADWWGFKIEAYDSIRENIPFVHKAGACAIVHSDDDYGIQRLNQEAAKALADGRNAGIDISKEEAWLWLSYNPAKALGIEEETGSLEVGKAADVVVWDGDPFSSYTHAAKVYIDGALVYDRETGRAPVTDFELGQAALEER